MSKKLSVNALENAKTRIGCFVKGGTLTPAYTAEVKGDCPDGATFAVYSNAVDKFFVYADGVLHQLNERTEFNRAYSLAGSPFLMEDINGEFTEAIVMSGNKAVMFAGIVDAMLTTDQALSCGTAHRGRIFGADANDGFLLRWSGGGTVADWQKGIGKSGSVKLDPARGVILNVVVFNGKLVAVREYGLTLLSMYGSPENFSVDITDTDCDKIYKDTTAIVLGKLYFYSSTGLKCFDGNTISPVLSDCAVSQPVRAVAYDGKYFLSCKSEVLNRSAILCADIDGGTSCIIDERADALFVKDGVCLCTAGKVKKLVEGGSYRIESDALDFGTGRLKTVTKIDVSGTADIRISNGSATRIFSGASGTVRPHMRGRSFTVRADGNCALNSVTVTAEVTDAI